MAFQFVERKSGASTADSHGQLLNDDARLWLQIKIVMYSIYGFDF